jgi:urea transport system permease protein
MSRYTVSLSTVVLTLAILFVGVPYLYVAGLVDITFINQLGRFLCMAMVALGMDLVWGYTGILSLCQAMFFCIGGYCMGMHLALHGPLDGAGIPHCLFVVTSQVSGFTLPGFWAPFRELPVALLLGMCVPGLLAFLFGYLSFRSRVRGVYLSIITQAFTVIAVLLFRRNELRLCGTNGLTNFDTLLGGDLNSPLSKFVLYIVSAVTLMVLYAVAHYIMMSRAGRILIAIRDNESRLRFSGFKPVHYKTFIFTIAAVMAAIGGMLYTPQNGIITPAKMETNESIAIVVWVAVGGRGTLAGAVLGALVMNYLGSLLTSWAANTWPFILAGLAITVVLIAPEGLLGCWQYLSAYVHRVNRSRGKPPSAPDPGGAGRSDDGPSLAVGPGAAS